VEPDELTQERIARNDAMFRDANEDIEAAAERFDVEADMAVPFICECADTACKAIIRMPLSEYEEVRSNSRYFLNAPGHHVAAQGAAVPVEEREGYVIVEKQGHAGEVTERLDQRQANGSGKAAEG
jgi:hypothetical protein